MNGTELREQLKMFQAKVQQARGALTILEQQKTEKLKLAQQQHDQAELLTQVKMLLAKVSEAARAQVQERIERLVSSALQAVFGEELRFKVILYELGGAPAARFEVESACGSSYISVAPEDSRGGGITDVVSLALRIAVLELIHPKQTAPMILDEPGKMISAEYAANVAYWLKQYARQTGRQIILVTHNSALADAADKTIKVIKIDGESEASEIA